MSHLEDLEEIRMEIKKVFIVGAGAMGIGIAQVIAEKRYNVYLNDVQVEQLDHAMSGLGEKLNRNIAKGTLSIEEKAKILGNITLHPELGDAAECQLVIEAASERMDVKKDIFKKLNNICGSETIIATNTSSLSITELAAVMEQPENFIGVHFFNPAPVMRLVEIISGMQTSEQTKSMVKQFCRTLGKDIVEVKDGPGFLVNRMLTMTLTEAVMLLEQGYGTVEDIDKSMVYGCSYPMGPLSLSDMVGVDITLAVAETLYSETEDSRYRVPLLLKKMVRAGYLGQKTGKGFYIYGKDGSKVPNPNIF